MTEYFQEKLFQNISLEEYKRLLICMGARTRRFTSGETICSYDADFQELGIIGKGSASVVRYEYNGARTILEKLGPQNLFGQIVSCDCGLSSGVYVVCDQPCEVLFLQYPKISSPCAKACSYHRQLIQNLLLLISEHSLELSRRVEVLSQRSIREKLMCFFRQIACRSHSTSFTLPFTMVDLADYLSVDRSAMTRELRRMKEEGLIRLEKKRVVLLSQ